MSDNLADVKQWQLPDLTFGDPFRCGRWWFMGLSASSSMAVVDLETYPPVVQHWKQDYAWHADWDGQNTVGLCSRPGNHEHGKFALSLRSYANPQVELRRFPLFRNGEPIQTKAVFAIADQWIAVGEWYEGTEQRVAFRLQGDELLPADDLPAEQGIASKISVRFTHGKATLQDGTQILIWDGDGYELQNGRFQRTWKLRADASSEWFSVPASDQGFFYLSERKIYLAQRGEAPRHMLPDAENVMSMTPGPEGSVLLRMGYNKKNLLYRIWFPHDGSYIPLRRVDFDAPHYASHMVPQWSETTGHFFMMYFSTVPVAQVLSRKRTKPRKI